MPPVANAKVSLLIGLVISQLPSPGHFVQGAIWEGGFWWVMNAQKNISGGGYESMYVNKFTSKGNYLGRMLLLGAGHGSVFCMIGDEVWVGWDIPAEKSPPARDLYHITWKQGARYHRSDATYVDTGVNPHVAALPLGDNRSQMTLRRSSGSYDYFYLCNRSNLKNHLKTIRVKKLHPSNKSNGTMQGAITFGDSLYVLYAATDDNPQQLGQWKWPAGSGQVNLDRPHSVLNITKTGRDSHYKAKEPEGFTVYGGRLVFGQVLKSGSLPRVFRQYYLTGSAIPPTPDPPPDPPVKPPVKPPWPPVTPPKPPPTDKCGPPPMPTTWLTGASGAKVPDEGFGLWRGTPIEAIGTWINDPAIYPFIPSNPGCPECGEYAAWPGAADIGIAPAPGIWQGWDAEAAGVNDAWWHQVGANLRAAWTARSRGTWYLRPYFEANGDWFEYAIKTKVASFKTAFARTMAILRQEFPEAKLMLGVAASSGPVAERPLVSSIWPDDASFDLLSIDFYNTYPWVNTAAAFATKIASGAGANSLDPLRVLAGTHGKQIVISEWATAAVNNGGGGGDAPEFIKAMNTWLLQHQDQVVMEVYFNVTEGYPEQYWLWNGTTPNLKQSQAAARYTTLW